MMSKSKECTKCTEVKPFTEFYISKNHPTGYSSHCSMCIKAKAVKVRAANPEKTRAKNLKSKFNMSIDDYNKLYIEQDGLCRICDEVETRRDSKGGVVWMPVDHCHDTGKIRGLLCSRCNTGLGLLGDSIKTLKCAIKYLRKEGSYGKE